MKDALSVNLSPAPHMTNDLSAAEGLVGVKLQKFGQGWAVMGSSPRLQGRFKGGFKIKPPLTNKPVIRR